MLSPNNIPSTGNCSFPLCKFKIDRGTHCLQHAKHFEPPREKKARTGVKKVSDKRKVEQVIYRKIVEEKIKAANGLCELKMPGCTIYAEGGDHRIKRSPKNYIDPDNIFASCNKCNLLKELEVGLAKEMGISISKFKK